jgi:hypothetical protein
MSSAYMPGLSMPAAAGAGPGTPAALFRHPQELRSCPKKDRPPHAELLSELGYVGMKGSEGNLKQSAAELPLPTSIAVHAAAASAKAWD